MIFSDWRSALVERIRETGAGDGVVMTAETGSSICVIVAWIMNAIAHEAAERRMMGSVVLQWSCPYRPLSLILR